MAAANPSVNDVRQHGAGKVTSGQDTCAVLTFNSGDTAGKGRVGVPDARRLKAEEGRNVGRR